VAEHVACSSVQGSGFGGCARGSGARCGGVARGSGARCGGGVRGSGARCDGRPGAPTRPGNYPRPSAPQLEEPIVRRAAALRPKLRHLIAFRRQSPIAFAMSGVTNLSGHDACLDEAPCHHGMPMMTRGLVKATNRVHSNSLHLKSQNLSGFIVELRSCGGDCGMLVGQGFGLRRSCPRQRSTLRRQRPRKRGTLRQLCPRQRSTLRRTPLVPPPAPVPSPVGAPAAAGTTNSMGRSSEGRRHCGRRSAT
jgi:hypothetical protein